MKKTFSDTASSIIRKGTFSVFVKRMKSDKGFAFSVSVLLSLFLVAIFAGQIAPKPYYMQDLSNALQPPSLAYPFGTDQLGRCIFSRVIYGSRIIIEVILLTVSISTTLGVILGLFAGYLGGVVDVIAARTNDTLLSIPSILIAMAIVAILGVGVHSAVIAVGLSQSADVFRLTRSLIMSDKEKLYVEAARAVGAGDRRIVFRHILPNIMNPILVQVTFNMAASVIWIAALSFVGLGTQPPSSDWGTMLFEGRLYFRVAPYSMIFPGVSIFLVSLALIMLSDSLREILDVRIRYL
jgi:ABC-type dipeptide/oligopeptide/nickel transport system permease subunit